MKDDTLIAKISKLLDREESDIEKLISQMDYKDIVTVSQELKNNNTKAVYKILHGYAL